MEVRIEGRKYDVPHVEGRAVHQKITIKTVPTSDTTGDIITYFDDNPIGVTHSVKMNAFQKLTRKSIHVFMKEEADKVAADIKAKQMQQQLAQTFEYNL